MSIVDTAKKLLEKGIRLDDEELISMANALLEQHKDEIQETSEPEHVEPPVPATRVDASQFEVKPRPYKKKSQAVNQVARGENLFVDDGTEHTDITTPDFVPTQRRNAVRMSKQVCEECGKSFNVSEVHRREFFVCDDCLRNRVR